MHELSIAMSLVEMACEEAERHGASRVAALHLRVGPLSGIVADALRFSFGIASADTPIDGAELLIVETPLVAHCPTCRRDQTIASVQRLRCPACGTATPHIIQGRELELAGLELEDAPEAHAAADR